MNTDLTEVWGCSSQAGLGCSILSMFALLIHLACQAQSYRLNTVVISDTITKHTFRIPANKCMHMSFKDGLK